MTTARSAVVALLATLAVPAVAQAHVSIQPATAPAGAYVVESVRVPNEREDAATTKVQLQLPDGFAAASYAPIAGWKVTVVRAKLATPIQTDDGEVTEGVKEITWTAQGDAGIQAGQFVDFPISVRIPGKAGDKLTFKALQTYEGGDVVRWIGGQDSDNPAPVLTVTAAQEDQHAAAESAEEKQDLHSEQTQEPREAASASPAPTAGRDDDDDDERDGLTFGLAIAGLLAGLGSLGVVLSRRS